MQRSVFTPAYAGIPIFLGLPFCMTPEDLKAVRADAVILGAPVDMTLGHRSAAYGPRFIRADERILPNIPSVSQNPDTRIKPFAVLQKAIDEALDGPKYNYISLDIDVHDPAFAPGAGTPQPSGLTPRELLPAIRRLCHETPVVGFEVVEVAPHIDPGYTTALYARRAILEALTGMAQRKLGIPEKNHLDPVVSGQIPIAEPVGVAFRW
ncbi:MAG: arginase family protein [Gemmataceae bacterium]